MYLNPPIAARSIPAPVPAAERAPIEVAPMIQAANVSLAGVVGVLRREGLADDWDGRADEPSSTSADGPVLRSPKGEFKGAAQLVALITTLQETMYAATDTLLKSNIDKYRQVHGDQVKKYTELAMQKDPEPTFWQKALNFLKSVFSFACYVFIAVNFVAALFTGGGTLIIASAMLALMAADAICEATGNKSVSSYATDPLMDKVITPAVQGLGGVVTSLLESLGVDERTAMMIGTAISVLVLVVAAVAAFVAFKSTNTGKLLIGAGKSLVKNSLRAAGRGASRLFSRAGAPGRAASHGVELLKVEAKWHSRASVASIFHDGAMIAGTAAQAGVTVTETTSDVQSALLHQDMLELDAVMSKLMAEIDVSDRMFDQAVEGWSDAIGRLQATFKNALSLQRQEASSAMSMV